MILVLILQHYMSIMFLFMRAKMVYMLFFIDKMVLDVRACF